MSFVNQSGVTSFVRMLVKLGVLYSQRTEFWRFISHALIQDKTRNVATGGNGVPLSAVKSGLQCADLIVNEVF